MNTLLAEQFFKNLILGKHPFVRSTSVYKRAILTGALCFLLAAIMLVYMFFDAYAGVSVSMPYYFVLLLACAASFFLNRMAYYNTAKVILLYSTLAMLYLFGTSEALYTGNYMSFFPLILASFALYGYKNRIYAIIFSLVALGAFLVMFFFPFEIIPLKPLPEPLYKINFVIHFVVSLGATFFIIMFFIKLNFTIENYLRNNELYLNKVLKELEGNKQRLELAFKGSNAGLYDWDIKSDSIYHSPMWKQILGYKDDGEEEFSIENFFDLVHPDDRNYIRMSLDDYLQQRSPKFIEEVRVRTSEGSYKWIMDSGMALWDDEGNPVRMVGSIIDISKIKEAELRIKEQNVMLEKTNEELDKFVYSTSHDLRAPLMSILGLIDITKNSKSKNEIDQCLELIANRVHRMDEFIAEIIDFSRNSRLGVVLEEIKLDSMVSEIVKDLQFMENANLVKVNFNIDKSFQLKSDKKRIETILKNLISNAYKYHNVRQKQPFINVSASRVNGTAKIMIEDNGDGIKSETRERIFEMFFRGSEKSKGSGLGLYIAKEMTEKLQGHIFIESTYGEGSKFTIEIPQ